VKRVLATAAATLIGVGALSTAPPLAADTLYLLYSSNGSGDTLESLTLDFGGCSNLNFSDASGKTGASLPLSQSDFDSLDTSPGVVTCFKDPGASDHTLLTWGEAWQNQSNPPGGSDLPRNAILTLVDDTADRTITATRCVGGSYTGSPLACDGTSEITVTILGASFTPSDGGGSSGGGSTSAAPILELNLDPVETDASCSVAGVSGTRGSWVALEAASDCTPPPTNPDATLLGWATTPDFPVDIAQRQIDNGWGAYEIFNDNGQLTSVFIPAGGMTRLTASNNLYAIWGS